MSDPVLRLLATGLVLAAAAWAAWTASKLALDRERAKRSPVLAAVLVVAGAVLLLAIVPALWLPTPPPPVALPPSVLPAPAASTEPVTSENHTPAVAERLRREKAAAIESGQEDLDAFRAKLLRE